MSTRIVAWIGSPCSARLACRHLPAVNRSTDSFHVHSLLSSAIRCFHEGSPARPSGRSIASHANGFARPATHRSWSTPVQKRTYRQMSTQEDKTTQSSTVKPVPTPVKSSSEVAKELVTDDASKVSDKQQSLTDWKIIKRLASNIWPKGEWEIKTRVVGALGLLVAGKVGSLLQASDRIAAKLNLGRPILLDSQRTSPIFLQGHCRRSERGNNCGYYRLDHRGYRNYRM